MKKIICEQMPSLTEDELKLVVGGRGYDGCVSKPRKIHKAATGGGSSGSGSSSGWKFGCNVHVVRTR